MVSKSNRRGEELIIYKEAVELATKRKDYLKELAEARKSGKDIDGLIHSMGMHALKAGLQALNVTGSRLTGLSNQTIGNLLRNVERALNNTLEGRGIGEYGNLRGPSYEDYAARLKADKAMQEENERLDAAETAGQEVQVNVDGSSSPRDVSELDTDAIIQKAYEGGDMTESNPKKPKTDEGELEGPVVMSAFGGSSLQQRGEETQVTKIPKFIPTRMPETVTFKHIYNARRYMSAESDSYNDNFSGFNLKFGINNPLAMVYQGTAITADDGGITAVSTGAAGNCSFWNYFYTIYKYFTVVHTKIRVHYVDMGFQSTETPSVSSSIPWEFYTDLPYIMYRDYGSQRIDSDATLASKNGRELQEDPLMNGKQFHFSSNAEGSSAITPQATSTLYYHVGRARECTVNQNFTHKSYERLMDIHGDAEDTIWVETDGSAEPTLAHTFECFHRWWDLGPIAVTLGGSVLYKVVADIQVEYTVQWKELKELYGPYYGTPTFP